ncbi:MAG: YraN family protein [Clostridia bacterium]|nr:YraN family protein [Clostridia bacterium]
MLPTSTLGKKYENMSIHYLKTQKYKILKRNFSCPAGEVDIIALDPETKYIVFIEVKYRATNAFGRPIEAITPDKVRKIYTTSQVYLKLNGLLDRNIRYDVIEIIDDDLRHVVNAF